MSDDVVLVRPSYEYAERIAAFRGEFASCLDWIHGAQGLRDIEDPYEWIEYSAGKESGATVRDGESPYSQFICVRVSDGKIVGMIGVRHRPVGPIETWGGHVGYCVCPSERRKGYATRMLGLVLPYCKSLDLKRVLLTAGDENEGSVKAILANGGVLENYCISPKHRIPVGRYWIDLTEL